MKNLKLVIVIWLIVTTMAYSQDNAKTEKQEIFNRNFIGSSLWMLGNFSSDPADFYQLSYGHHLTQKDVVMVEAITWKYHEPLGTYGNSKEDYPGEIKAYGIGFGYQRFHWKKLFTTVVATPFLQQFYDTDDRKIKKGFQLYIQFILGYRFEFFNDRIFVEPAYALKYWPVNTNFPASFARVEKGAPNYKFEPSLNFGYRF